jgi:hypothetical protein
MPGPQRPDSPARTDRQRPASWPPAASATTTTDATSHFHSPYPPARTTSPRATSVTRGRPGPSPSRPRRRTSGGRLRHPVTGPPAPPTAPTGARVRFRGGGQRWLNDLRQGPVSTAATRTAVLRTTLRGRSWFSPAGSPGARPRRAGGEPARSAATTASRRQPARDRRSRHPCQYPASTTSGASGIAAPRSPVVQTTWPGNRRRGAAPSLTPAPMGASDRPRATHGAGGARPAESYGRPATVTVTNRFLSLTLELDWNPMTPDRPLTQSAATSSDLST